jgi:hypothetical protein
MNQRSYADNHLVAVITPALVDNNTAGSAWIDMGQYARLFAVVAVGGTDTTVDVKIQQSAASNGGSPKDVTGAAVTQLTADTGDNKYVTIEMEAALMDIKNGYRYAQVLITVGDGTAGATVAGFILCPARHAPVTQPAALAQSVVVAG